MENAKTKNMHISLLGQYLHIDCLSKTNITKKIFSKEIINMRVLGLKKIKVMIESIIDK